MKSINKNINYAQKILIEYAEHKQLKKFWKENVEGKGFNFVYLWNITKGKFNPSLEFIWICRKIINPVFWFYSLTEQKPVECKISKLPERYDYYTNKNFLFICNLEALGLWCRKNKISYNMLWLLKNHKRKITFKKILLFNKYLPVSGWFEF